MSNYRDLRVLNAAEQLADDVEALLARPSVLHKSQIRRSSQSIGSNIREGFGRGMTGERNRALRTARGEVEETVGHLRTNYAATRISRSEFFQFRNRLQVITKMLTRLIGD